MNPFLRIFSALLLSTALTVPCAQADTLSDCYRTAENRVQVRQCLQKEYEQTQHEYSSLLDQLKKQIRQTEDTGNQETAGNRKGLAGKSLQEANRAFAAYMKHQCDFETQMDEGGQSTEAGNQQLSCRISLMKIRIGAVSSFLESEPASAGSAEK